jgi:PAS domain S-box-containing protein
MLPNAVVVVDGTQVVFANQTTLELLGLSELDQVVGKSIQNFVLPADQERVTVHYENALQGDGMIDAIEVEVIRRDSEPLAVELSAQSIEFYGRAALMVVLHDVTERTHHEADLVAAKNQAEIANKAKSDLRTPMNAILGFSQLLRLDHDHVLTEEYQVYVDQIMNAGTHLLALIDDVLNLEKIEAGEAELELEFLDTRQLVNQCLSVVQPAADNLGVGIEDLTHGRELTPVWGEATAFKQVLINLLSNAIKYNRPGGTVNLNVMEPNSGLSEISVADTGRGIPLDRQGEVFEPFNRLGAENSGVEGTGIGLSIAKRQVEMMGGSIWFESADGQGTKFAIQYRTDTHNGSKLSSDSFGPKRRQISLLYVDDNDANISAMEHMLGAKEEVRLTVVSDGEAAVSRVKQDCPDVILMTPNLLGMCGEETVKRLGQLGSMPIVAVGEEPATEVESQLLCAGYSSYLSRPVSTDDVWRAVDKSISEKRAVN